MRKHLALISYALGCITRNRIRSLAIGLGLVLVSGYLASVIFLTDALRYEYTAGIQQLPDLTVQRLVAGRPATLSPDSVEAIRQIPGVIRVVPRVWGYVFFPSLSGNITVLALPDDEQAQGDLAGLIGEGRPPLGPGEAVLGIDLARFVGLEAGDGIGLAVAGKTVSLEIVGLLDSQSALYAGDLLVTDKASARDLLNLPRPATSDLAVWLSTPDEASVVARKIVDRMADARVVDKQLMSRAYDLTFNTRAGTITALLLPALFALLLLVWDRFSDFGQRTRREVGLLKILGWLTSDILMARLYESIVIAFLACAVGVVAAYIHVFLAGAPLLAAALLGWSAIYPVLNLTPAVDLGQALMLIAFVAVPVVAASLYPAWRNAVAPPAETLRGAR